MAQFVFSEPGFGRGIRLRPEAEREQEQNGEKPWPMENICAHFAITTKNPEVQNEKALARCRRYGQIAPGVGPALYLPGHVYATAGMWRAAAVSMDHPATRAEKHYMLDRLTFHAAAFRDA
jgi:hypothetical protein